MMMMIIIIIIIILFKFKFSKFLNLYNPHVATLIEAGCVRFQIRFAARFTKRENGVSIAHHFPLSI